MSQSLVKNLIHLVYSTKYRQSSIPPQFSSALWAYQAGIFSNLNCPAIVVSGVEDHVHSLFSLCKNQSLKSVVEEVTKSSSRWMKTDGTRDSAFYWQSGYSAFSVSQSNIDAVKRYIENQAEHHRHLTFKDELRLLLERHSIEFDEQYIWE